MALLGVDIAAASNTEGPDAIHGMIDRYRQAALPFAGPPLVSEYYRRVPLGSIIWTIARPPAASSSEDHAELLLPGGWSGLLPPNSMVIASARPLNDVHLRAQVLTHSEAEARGFTDRVKTFLALFKSLDISMDGGGPDPDVKAAFDSLEIHQDKDEARADGQGAVRLFQEGTERAAGGIGTGHTKAAEQKAPAAKKPRRVMRLTGGNSSRIDGRAAQEFVRIHRRVVDAHFVVQVRSGAASAESDVADDLSPTHRLPVGNRESGQVTIAGGNAVAVVDLDHAAVTVVEVRRR